MYMRIVQHKVNPDKVEDFHKYYEARIVPAMQNLPGCFCATLIKSDLHPDEYLSMTLWDNRKDAEAYEKSGLFEEFITELRPFLSDSSEWKIQLSEDFTLEYQPVEEDPVVVSYPVVEQLKADLSAGEATGLMHMRVVSLKVKPGKLDEFKKLYRDEILSALESVKGCRYAYLTESLQEANQLFSVTIWDSKADAENYEKSGLFDLLTERVKHTLSELYQWKMALERDSGKRLVTSDDLKVDHYSVVTGKNFQAEA